MIIVKILGGLGNQMFQYAAARALSLKLNTDLYLDNDSLLRHKERFFDLDYFKFEKKLTSKNKKIFFRLGLGILAYPLIRLKKHPAYYFERNFSYNSELKHLGVNQYLDGYFQSEKYFQDYEDVIRKDFEFVGLANETEKKYVNLMENKTAVSLHVRRGDYVTNLAASTTLGALKLDYYERAMQIMEKQFPDLEYFIFSDDLNWVKDNLKFTRPFHLVAGNSGQNSFRDMRLMSCCDHHIIANSSFSWWGAWLNPKKNKVVISPKDWFQNKTIDDRDLIPEKWMRV